MNETPLTPAALTHTDDGIPYSARYADIYHPRAGALQQARHVFIAGNGLPERWQGRERFVVLETGFGLGNNFLATWQAWRDDPLRCDRLVFISIEAHPLTRAELSQAHATSPMPELAGELQRAWPPLTANLHSLSFDADRVQLLLAFGDVQAWLPELVASVDAFYLDGFAPARNPRMWDDRVCRALSRLAAAEARLATWSAASALREHLTTAGFEVKIGQGRGGKRDITLARYAPRFTPRHAPARPLAQVGLDRRVLIVGGGLAGCAAAWALAEQGWRASVFERRGQVAAEASGNPGGLFHGIVNAQDGVHARFNRAAALQARDAVRTAIDAHGVAGAVDGLLRLNPVGTIEAMSAVLRSAGLPPDYVQAVDAAAASALGGIALDRPAWFYPGGGWVDPAGLARSWLARAGAHVELRTDAEVHGLRRSALGWALLDAQGATLAEAPSVVLANAAAAFELLVPLGVFEGGDWPIERLRGQLSIVPAALLGGSRLPTRPIAGAGYLLPELPGGVAVFGATSQRDDADPAVRASDHHLNLARLAQLVGQVPPLAIDALAGRTAWRCGTIDKLPVIGAVPDPRATGRLDQPRLVPRLPNLFVFSALGSRGITWSALGARVLAALMTGAPVPLEASLLDAIDPARFVSRRARGATPR